MFYFYPWYNSVANMYYYSVCGYAVSLSIVADMNVASAVALASGRQRSGNRSDVNPDRSTLPDTSPKKVSKPSTSVRGHVVASLGTYVLV